MTLNVDDLLVQYRDRNLVLRGSIPKDDLDLKMQPVTNGVGSWSLSLPAEHRAVSYLRTPGAGIVVTNLSTGQIVMSGTASKPTQRKTITDVEGMVGIAGLSDDRLLWDALAYPQPSNADVTTQNVSHDTFAAADAETLMRHLVDANIGPGAPASRVANSLREFVVLEASNTNLGAAVDKPVRFAKLGDALREIATLRDLRFRLVQVGNTLEFQVDAVSDRTAFIRLDVVNGTLQEQGVEFAPPEVTRVVVAGQGEGVERQFILRTSSEATTAEDDWGLIIEEFKDQRNTNEETTLEQSGDEILAARGFTKVAVKAVPTNEETMVFQEDYNLGDKVTVVIDGQETSSSITEAAIVANKMGVVSAIAIGDISDFDSDSALRQTVTDTQRRVSELERNAETTDYSTAVADLQTVVADLIAPPVGKLSNGSSVSVSSSSTVAEFSMGTTDYLGGGVTVSGDRLVVPKDGVYRILASIMWQVSSAGNRLLLVWVNGAQPNSQSLIGPGHASNSWGGVFTIDLLLSAGDEISAAGWQNSGGNLNRNYTSVSVAYVGPAA